MTDLYIAMILFFAGISAVLAWALLAGLSRQRESIRDLDARWSERLAAPSPASPVAEAAAPTPSAEAQPPAGPPEPPPTDPALWVRLDAVEARLASLEIQVASLRPPPPPSTTANPPEPEKARTPGFRRIFP